jgi:hypothetical protein
VEVPFLTNTKVVPSTVEKLSASEKVAVTLVS